MINAEEQIKPGVFQVSIKHKTKAKSIAAVSSIIIVMLYLTMLVDFTNGMIPGLHIGEIFRMLLLALCSLYIYRFGRKEKVIYTLILLYLLMNVAVSSIYFKVGWSTNLSMALKSCILYAIYFALTTMYKQGRIHRTDIDKIVKYNLYYAPGIFIASYLLGIGNSSYRYSGVNLGFKSGFLSLNSVNVALIVLYIFAVDRFFRMKTKKWAFFSIYVMIPMAMLGTKTGYAIIVAIPLLYILLGIRKKRTWVILITGVIVLTVFGRSIMNRLLPMFQGIIDRQRLMFSQRSLWTFLTSTRNIRVHNVLTYYFANTNPLSVIFGTGYYWIHNIAAGMEISTTAVIPLEMDWADLLVTYGIIGLTFSYLFVGKRILSMRSQRKIRESGTIYFWSSLILLLYGSVAGHLFFEAISSTFFAVSLAGLYVSCHEKKRFKINSKSGEYYIDII